MMYSPMSIFRVPVKHTYKNIVKNKTVNTYLCQSIDYSRARIATCIPNANYRRLHSNRSAQGTVATLCIPYTLFKPSHANHCILTYFSSEVTYPQSSEDKDNELAVEGTTHKSAVIKEDTILSQESGLSASQNIFSNIAKIEGEQTKKKKKKQKKIFKRFEWQRSNRPEVHLDLETEQAILQGELKCHNRKIKVINPPEEATRTINRILKGDVGGESYGNIGDQFSHYFDAGIKFKRYLDSRKPAVEDSIRKISRDRIEAKVRRQLENQVRDLDLVSLYDELQLETEIQKKTEKLFNLKIATLDAQSKDIHYDKNGAWAYLLGKAAFDYATIYKVMTEIKNRTEQLASSKYIEKSVKQENVTFQNHNTGFQPRTLFDFGSGIGTSLWAAKEVFGDISEAFCVDLSKDMTDLAIAIIMKGHMQYSLPAGYTFRLHLPRDDSITYDLVTCSHTLLHIPTELERINIVDNLWRKTSPDGGFLILVENGTNAGFQVLQEARHYLLQVIKHQNEHSSTTAGSNLIDSAVEDLSDLDELKEYRSEVKDVAQEAADEIVTGHLFSPCPHEKACPRYEFDSIPCNFDIRYRNFQLEKIHKSIREDVQEGRFTYTVFRKGRKTKDCEWPRIVEPPKPCNHGHGICRLCTSRGTLEEILTTNVNKIPKNKYLFSKKLLHKYTKSLNSGDQLKGYLECGFEDYEDFVEWAKPKPTDTTVPEYEEK